VQDPTHPLFGRTFRVIRRSVHRGGVEGLRDLISVAEQLENHDDKAGRPLGHAAGDRAAPNRRRSRRSSGGGVS
jgi:hypothetical protein